MTFVNITFKVKYLRVSIFFFSDEDWKLKGKVSNLKKMLKLKRGAESFDSESQMTDTWYVHNFSQLNSILLCPIFVINLKFP